MSYLCNEGRSLMKQYVPKKPIRRRFKVWVVADSLNGYFLYVDVYTGKPSDGVTTERGLGERVVLHLTEHYRHKNHQVFCDNFFLCLHSLMNCWYMGCMLAALFTAIGVSFQQN